MGVPALLLIGLLCASLRAYSALLLPSDGYTEGSKCTRNGGAVYDDPLTSFRLAKPMEGAVEVLPIEIRFLIDARNTRDYEAYYADASFCVELNGLWNKCKAPGGPPMTFNLLPEGNYTAVAYITDTSGEARYHTAKSISFTVQSSGEFNLRNRKLVERSQKEQHFPKDVHLLQWAEMERQVEIEDFEDDNIVLPRSHVSHTNSPMLVIGVKTAVVKGFSRRQAIRDTWANPAMLPLDVKVLFLGGEPSLIDLKNEGERRRVLQAIAKERAVYRDLLTEELECTDSYRGLSDKVKSFMHLAEVEFPDTKFVMLADDDIYLKIDQLMENLRQEKRPLYFGEVWAVKFAHKQEPIRDGNSPYYLPSDQYSMRNLLPYAVGPHYVVSMAGVRFIAKNYWRLRSMNGLEDVSTGFWLRAVHMNAQHTPAFSSVRASLACNDNLVSFADLSPLGIRSVHTNLINNRSFCYGFHPVTWHRHLHSIPSLEKLLQQPSQVAAEPSLQLETVLSNSNSDQMTVIVSTPFTAGIKSQFSSSIDSLDEFVQNMCDQVTSTQTCSTTLRRQLECHVSYPYQICQSHDKV
ncbi:Galactosyltransferase [Phytophthora infestans]|uniref:Galactosyltransferase n=1 Tax=Phytophthora infestans TaxID=4787 RepID=A0A833S2Q4_PHYIN|nr:Galactosyltransferase [Phytophthora infestans]